MSKPILGIMVCSNKNNLFYESDFYKLLQRLGAKKNILVYVFFPNSINWEKNNVEGYHYDFTLKKWVSAWFPLPNYIYDRCFYTSLDKFLKYKPHVKKIMKQKNIHFLGIGLKGKWEVHRILLNSSKFAEYLPKTEILQNPSQISLWLRKGPFILKPTGGSHGASVIRISKETAGYEVVGRNHFNKKIKLFFKLEKDLLQWIMLFTAKRRFIIQQYLYLNTSKNQPYDIRVLVQKSKSGKWEVTGMAARIGEAENITSNLHGGGRVEPAESLINKEFNSETAKKIIDDIYSIASSIPSFIETNHGHLFEIGLDLGIDRQGHIWVIEINSKPGRKIFRLLNDQEKIIKSLTQPILYTEYLSNLNRIIASTINASN